MSPLLLGRCQYNVVGTAAAISAALTLFIQQTLQAPLSSLVMGSAAYAPEYPEHCIMLASLRSP